jgi:hypothetical protein
VSGSRLLESRTLMPKRPPDAEIKAA